MIPNPNDKVAWEKYMYKKTIESYEELCEDMGIGDVVDEHNEAICADDWYWRGCSEEMNEDIE